MNVCFWLYTFNVELDELWEYDKNNIVDGFHVTVSPWERIGHDESLIISSIAGAICASWCRPQL